MLRCIAFSYGPIRGSSKSTFSKYSFGRERGGHKNSTYSVYAFDNVDNYGRPLTAIIDDAYNGLVIVVQPWQSENV